MSEFWRPETLGYLGLWLLLALGSILARLLPLSVPEGSWPGPDLLLALTLAWVLRRPAHLPVGAIALVFLAEDLFLMRPPGLWALCVVAGTEFLRRRQSVVREMNLMLEWGLVAVVMVAMLLAWRIGLAVVMVPGPAWNLSILQLAATVVAYPLVVWVLQALLRVRKPATGEVDELGRKI